MHNPESVLKNKLHKILWAFEMQTDHLISARRPDQVIINEKREPAQIVDFGVPTDHTVKLKKKAKREINM